MKKWIKTHSKLLVLCSIGGLGGFLIILVAIFTVLFFSNNRCSDNAGTSDTDISSGFTGSWTTQGTEAYKNAKATFDFWVSRSEEHTSELQSRFDLVCRLLLEKKNTIAVLP